MGVFPGNMSFLQAAYGWAGLLVQSGGLNVFTGEYSPFRFKAIIGREKLTLVILVIHFVSSVYLLFMFVL